MNQTIKITLIGTPEGVQFKTEASSLSQGDTTPVEAIGRRLESMAQDMGAIPVMSICEACGASAPFWIRINHQPSCPNR